MKKMERFLCLLLALILPACALGDGETAPSALQVLEKMQNGACGEVYALLDDTMAAALSVKDLETLLPSLEASFGSLKEIGKETVSQVSGYTVAALPLKYDRGSLLFQVSWLNGRIAGMYFAPMEEQAPQAAEAAPQGVTEEAVSVGDPALPGMLTMPTESDAPLPAVVLLHGSGPNDLDETIGQTKLFRDLAWGLAQKGIAVLRYDKRTYVYGKDYTREELAAFTVQQEAIDDALAAAALLKEDSRIDPSRVFLAGHSLGGCIAPRIARENPGIFAGLLLLSASPLTLGDIVILQNRAAVSQASPLLQPALSQQVDSLENEWQSIREGTKENALQKTFAGQSAYYFWDLARHDTAEDLLSLAMPVLIINGGRDFQVTAEAGYDAWKALPLRDNVHVIPEETLNHLLMDPDAPEGVQGTQGEYDVPCHVPDHVIDKLSSFILQ